MESVKAQFSARMGSPFTNRHGCSATISGWLYATPTCIKASTTLWWCISSLLLIKQEETGLIESFSPLATVSSRSSRHRSAMPPGPEQVESVGRVVVTEFWSGLEEYVALGTTPVQ